MASGHAHEKATKIWTLPFAVAISVVIGVPNAILGGLAFAVGGLWLSPDLDTKSKSLKRWGTLQNLWWPYRKLIAHRSIFSHGLIIGTTIRIIYLLSLATLILLFLEAIGIANALTLFKAIITLIQNNSEYTLSIIFGLEASAWLHLIKDGDPIPKNWLPWKRLR